MAVAAHWLCLAEVCLSCDVFDVKYCRKIVASRQSWVNDTDSQVMSREVPEKKR